MKYRKKPVEVEAFHLSPMHLSAIFSSSGFPKWFKDDLYSKKIEVHLDSKECISCVIIKTLEGEMKAYQGDYIIKGIKGEIYPCKEDVFLETYEPC